MCCCALKCGIIIMRCNYMNKDWDNNYKLICEYYKQNGNLDIMAREKFKDVELGTWLGKIRQTYRNGHLSEEKINKALQQLAGVF